MHPSSFATVNSLVSGRDVIILKQGGGILIDCMLDLNSNFGGLDGIVGGSRNCRVVFEVRPTEFADSFSKQGSNVV